MMKLARELRQAWRSLLQRKAYFLACAGTLTLVLGANAAMFAVVNATMLRPMPFATDGRGRPPVQSTTRDDGCCCSETRCSKWKCRAFASGCARWPGSRATCCPNV